MSSNCQDSEPVLRQFVATDSARIATLVSAAPTAAQWSQESYALLAEAPYFAVVLAHGDSIVGFVAVRVVAGEGEILNLVVDALDRRKGLGGRLLDAAEREAQSRDAESMFLEVRESNAAAICFYESNGFKGAGSRANYYRDPNEAAIVMKKPLMRKV